MPCFARPGAARGVGGRAGEGRRRLESRSRRTSRMRERWRGRGGGAAEGRVGARATESSEMGSAIGETADAESGKRSRPPAPAPSWRGLPARPTLCADRRSARPQLRSSLLSNLGKLVSSGLPSQVGPGQPPARLQESGSRSRSSRLPPLLVARRLPGMRRDRSIYSRASCRLVVRSRNAENRALVRPRSPRAPLEPPLRSPRRSRFSRCPRLALPARTGSSQMTSIPRRRCRASVRPAASLAVDPSRRPSMKSPPTAKVREPSTCGTDSLSHTLALSLARPVHRDLGAARDARVRQRVVAAVPPS